MGCSRESERPKQRPQPQQERNMLNPSADCGTPSSPSGRRIIPIATAGASPASSSAFCMQNIRFCDIVIIFTDVLKACRSTIIAIGNDHFFLDNKGTDLSSYTIRVLRPYQSHFKITPVKSHLFFSK